jgi:steroid delta-isomerase-like uncharacterized protein
MTVSDAALRKTQEFVQDFYDRIWNAGDFGAVSILLAPEFAFRGSLGQEMRGRDAFWQYAIAVRSALEGYRCDILDCVTEGEKVFAKMRFSGVHVAPFRGYAPTGKYVQWLGAALFRMHRQQIAELWVLGDIVSLEASLKTNAAT